MPNRRRAPRGADPEVPDTGREAKTTAGRDAVEPLAEIAELISWLQASMVKDLGELRTRLNDLQGRVERVERRGAGATGRRGGAAPETARPGGKAARAEVKRARAAQKQQRRQTSRAPARGREPPKPSGAGRPAGNPDATGSARAAEEPPDKPAPRPRPAQINPPAVPMLLDLPRGDGAMSRSDSASPVASNGGAQGAIRVLTATPTVAAPLPVKPPAVPRPVAVRRRRDVDALAARTVILVSDAVRVTRALHAAARRWSRDRRLK